MSETTMTLTIWAQGFIAAGCVGLALFVLARIILNWLRKANKFLEDYMEMHEGGEL